MTLETELCCLQYEVYTHGSGRTSLQDNQSLQELLPWRHVHSWAKKPFLGTDSCSEGTLKKALAAPEEAVHTDAQMPHAHCSVSLRRRNLGLAGQAGSAQPAWRQWAAQSSQVIPESGSMMPNEPLKTLPCTPCAHGDTTFHTSPERGCGQWAFGMNAVQLQDVANPASQSWVRSGHIPSPTAQCPPVVEEPCAKTVILRITVFLTDLLTFC